MSPTYYHKDRFPPDKLDWERLVPLIGPASAAVARYDGILSAVPNASILLSPLTTQEAVLSSRIEGTQATMGEVLKYEAEGDSDRLSPERKADIQEIINYRQAMREAEKMLKDLPLCQRIVKASHRILMTGVRGQGKLPGKYRKTPNWVGNVQKLWHDPARGQFSNHGLLKRCCVARRELGALCARMGPKEARRSTGRPQR